MGRLFCEFKHQTGGQLAKIIFASFFFRGLEDCIMSRLYVILWFLCCSIFSMLSYKEKPHVAASELSSPRSKEYC